jgi:hypothetical protein
MAYKAHNSAAETIRPMIDASDVEDNISISALELIRLMAISKKGVQSVDSPAPRPPLNNAGTRTLHVL